MRGQLIRAVLLCACVALGGCERRDPPAPAPGGNQGETITGSERIGWDQRASNAGELATFRYAIYVDGARSEILDVTCATAAGAAGFACSGRLPSMSAGTHTLALAAFTFDGSTLLESERSAPFRVTVTGAVAGGGTVPWASGPAGVTSDGVQLHVERIAEGLVDPVDAVALPDGRVLIAERGGRIHVLDEARLLDTGAGLASELEDTGALLSVAIDPAFSRTRFVFVLYAAPSREGLAYRLARFREVASRLGERAIIDNHLADAGATPSGIVRMDGDGQLLLALGPDAGHVLRRGGNALLGGLAAPGGLAWDPRRALAWVLDRRDDDAVLNGVAVPAGQPAQVRLAYRVKARDARSIAVYDGPMFPAFAGDVLVASGDGRHLARLRIDVETGRVRGEPLLQDLVGDIRGVTIAPGGSIYFLTADAIGAIRARRD